MSNGTISRAKVISLLKDISSGKMEVRVKFGHETWDECFAGNVDFISGKYELTVFNDCDSFDYIDSIRYGGKEANFEKIYNYSIWKEFSDSEKNRLEEIFKAAR